MVCEPTDEQLERAWSELAQPGWGTLAEVRTAARHYSLVRARAAALASGRPLPPVQIEGNNRPRCMAVPKHPPILDRKRLASGEREDD